MYNLQQIWGGGGGSKDVGAFWGENGGCHIEPEKDHERDMVAEERDRDLNWLQSQ